MRPPTAALVALSLLLVTGILHAGTRWATAQRVPAWSIPVTSKRERATRAAVGGRMKHSYTSSMKTAISVPEEIFAQAERLRRKLGKSRSELYSEAVREYLASHDPDEITERLNRLADELYEEYGAFEGMARRVLQRAEWD